MKVTASINFEHKKTWNGIRKHLDHDPNVDHKNKFLNTEESKQRRKLNQWVKFYDFDDLIEDKFSDYIATQNKKNMDKGRLERCWHSIHDFETKSASGTARTKTLDKLAVFTFSNEDDFDNKIFEPMVKAYASKYPNKSDREIDDKIRGCISHGLIRYTKGFNKRNPNLIMIEGVTHMDEKGSPHVHARVLPYVPSKIKNGKPKWSMNNALRQQFGHRDTRGNMKDFRDKEDRAILQAINKQIQIELPEIAKDYQFDLVRLHPAVKGLEHDEYKAIKQREDIKKNNQRLAEQQNKLNSLKKQIKDATADLKNQQDEIRKVQQKQAERAKKLDKREKQVSQQEQQVNERAQQVDSIYIELQSVLKQLKEYQDKTKEYMKKLAKRAEHPAHWVINVMMQGFRDHFDASSPHRGNRVLHEAGEIYLYRDDNGKYINRDSLNNLYDETEKRIITQNANARKALEQKHKEIQNMPDVETDYQNYKDLSN